MADHEGVDDWELKKVPNGDYFWSESRQESKWADEGEDEEEVSAETENEEYEEEESVPPPVIGTASPPRTESRNSVVKPVLDFDDLSGDEFDLDGELPPPTDFHNYESDGQGREEETPPEPDAEPEPEAEQVVAKVEGDDEGVDDWELKKDPGGDYYWSESRQESKWAEE